MDALAAFLERLDADPSDADAAQLLAHFLRAEPDPDRGLALGWMLGALTAPRMSRAAFEALTARLDPELYAIARATCGEAAEAAALMWPGAPRASAVPLAEVFSRLEGNGDKADPDVVADLLKSLAPSARRLLLRMLAGRAKPPLSVRVAQAALAEMGGTSVDAVEAVWHAAAPPYQALFDWLEGRADRPAPAARAPFRPLAVCLELEHAAALDLDVAEIAADYAWAGLRVLACLDSGARRLYSRRGEDVGAQAPHILDALDASAEIEGVLLPDPRAGLSRAATARVRLIAFDCLRMDDQDLERAPFEERRRALEDLLGGLGSGALTLNPLVRAGSRAELDAAREAARAEGAEGLVLKRWDAPYPSPRANAPWRLWRCAPHAVDAVLMYIAGGRGVETIATFGVWDGEGLAPIAKIELAEADEAAAAAICDYLDANETGRVGPVREAAPGLVARLTFGAVKRAPRRKAGFILTGLKIEKVAAAAPDEAGRLEDLQALAPRMGAYL